MSNKKDDKISKKTIIGWIVTIVAAIIGALGITTVANNNIVINIDGKNVEIDKNNAQSVYSSVENKVDELSKQIDELEKEKSNLDSQVNNLREEKDSLNSELKEYKEQNEYIAKDSDVTVNPNYSKKEVSIFSFTPVDSTNWVSRINEGSTIDSLSNEYEVHKPYIIMDGYSYAKYYTNGQFSKLKFKIAPHESMTGRVTLAITISTDSGNVKTIDSIDCSFIPKDYTIDLKGSDFVTIQCNSGWTSANVLLLDATFYK